MFVLCCLGWVRVVILLFGRAGEGACFFLRFGRADDFFCGLGRSVLFCLGAIGRGTGVDSLAGLPGLSLMEPNNKKTRQQKQKTRAPLKT